MWRKPCDVLEICDCPYSDEKYPCVQRGETYFIIGLGEDILKKAETSATLKNMACAGKGVYTQGFPLAPCLT